MGLQLLGLHHVTATVDDAQADLDFCAGALGLRLVKKTVNFDNHHVYHFYYGDERGTPGTIWTTFPYKGHGVRVGIEGRGADHGDVVLGAARVARRLERAGWRDRGVAVRDEPPRFGEDVAHRASIRPASCSSSSQPTATRATPWTGRGVEPRTPRFAASTASTLTHRDRRSRRSRS